MKHLLSIVLLIMFSGLSAQTFFEKLYNEVAKTTQHVEKVYNAYSSNINSWSANAGNDIVNYTTSSGKSFEQFAQEAESEMNSRAKQLVNDMGKATNTLVSLTELKCENYTTPVTVAIKNMSTPLDDYPDASAECKACIAWAIQEFICEVPKIFEGNIALIKRFNGTMNESDIKEFDPAVQPAAAMAKIVYRDFAESFLFILQTKDKLLSQAGITPSSEHLNVLYSESSCKMYGSEALGFLLDKIEAKNPTHRIQNLTNKFLHILEKMDKANTYAARFNKLKEYVQSVSYQAQVAKQVPAATSMYPGGVKIGAGWDIYETIIASNNGYVYGIKPNGDLHGYSHMVATENVWEGGDKLGAGWDIYDQVFAGTDRTIYGIDKEGVLWWYKNNSLYQDEWEGRNKIGAGWQIFRHVKAGSDGMIYPIQSSNNNLLWYKNSPAGQSSWHPLSGKNAVGTGWDTETVKYLLAGQDGVVFLIRPDGNLYWYLNTRHGEQHWSNDARGLLIDTGWNKYNYVFGGKDNIIYGVAANGDLYRHDFN